MASICSSRIRRISSTDLGCSIAPCPVGTISSDCAESRCELQYGTTPSELLGVSPRPRSPIMELCGALIGSLSSARSNGFFGERPAMLVGGRNFRGSPLGATATITASGMAWRTLPGKRISLRPRAPMLLVERELPRCGVATNMTRLTIGSAGKSSACLIVELFGCEA
jgi:hypothetical protein